MPDKLLLFRVIILRLLCWCLIAARSSSLQLAGAPVKASTAAWVGMCRYGTGVFLISTGTSVDLVCLCLSAAFFAPLILEKIDILVERPDSTEVMRRSVATVQNE